MQKGTDISIGANVSTTLKLESSTQPASTSQEQRSAPEPKLAGNIEDTAQASFFRRSSERLGDIFWFLIAWACLIGFWELGAAQGFINDRILPPPSEIVSYLLQGAAGAGYGVQRVGIIKSIGVTVLRIVVGLVLGLSSAMLLGARTHLTGGLDPFCHCNRRYRQPRRCFYRVYGNLRLHVSVGRCGL